VCVWKVAGADQELLHNFPPGEDEGLLQDLNAITTRKASYFQRKSFSNRQVEIISNTKVDTWQRFALLALGRAWSMFGSRKKPKQEKCLKMAQNPQRPVHALLGVRLQALMLDIRSHQNRAKLQFFCPIRSFV
jgi:hypothetical protein